MTALKKFGRLEAKAVWIENANSPPKSVIISFGKSSIIISDKNAFPLDHWNFNSIIVIKHTVNTGTSVASLATAVTSPFSASASAAASTSFSNHSFS